MSKGWQGLMAGALAAALVLPVAAQRADEEGAPVGATAETTALLEDVAVLRAVNPLQLTAAQLSALLPRLEAGAAQVRQAEAADVTAWIAAARSIRQAIPQAAVGGPVTAADSELARVEAATRGNVEAARRRTRDEVRALLEPSLSAAQMAALITAGRQELAARRMERLEEGDLRMVDRYGRQLDRLREASAQEYAQERRRFAGQVADLPDAGRASWVGSRAGRVGGATPRGPQRDGLQIEQERLQRRELLAETRQQLADPARRAQYNQALATADRIRAMAPALYARQRNQLSLQLLQTVSQSRAQTASTEEAINAFIERYLLSPRAPVVLKERLQAMTG
jgi:hypothetical protein